jgi:hypothetical protein
MEGNAMQTQRTSCAVIVVLVCAVALAPLSSAALQLEECLEGISVQGPVSHDGSFVGDLTMVAFSVGEAGQVLLTGMLNGTATNTTGAKIKVQKQPFTAPVTVNDSGWTTDVLLLDIEPISLDSLGLQIKLAQIILDLDAVPREDALSVKLLNYHELQSATTSPAGSAYTQKGPTTISKALLAGSTSFSDRPNQAIGIHTGAVAMILRP